MRVKMPVPTWDCPELVMLYDQPVDVTTTTVVSEDIWKKFDLDFPQPLSLDSTGYNRYYGGVDDGVIHEPYDRSTTFGIYEKSGLSPLLSCSSTSRIEAREIRHHDCMWAGLCISKEHNRTHPAKKKEAYNPSKKLAVPAGRSLLINRKQPGGCSAATPSAPAALAKNLESDGDSTRPETPQSCESESEEEAEDEEDEEMPRFKHDSISINEKLSEYVRVGNGEIHPSAAVPVSEVTGQLIPRKVQRVNLRGGQTNQQQGVKYARKDESKSHFFNNNGGNNRQDFNRSTNSVYAKNNNCTNIVSLGDHCYHLIQNSSSKKLEHLGVQTPSDSEEEIDVVTFEKPSCRPASLPTNPSLADKQHLQKTVTSALKDKAPPPRPRGRPPSTSTPRKRTAQSETAAKRPAKKPRQKTTISYQKRNNNRTNNNNDDNGNSNSNQNNKSIAEIDEDRCNSRVSIDTDCSDVNDEPSAGEKNGASSTTIRGSSSGNKESNRVSNPGLTRSTNSRSTSSDEEPDTEKRSLHNNMERQRRIELRKAFEDLRVLVPEVEMKEKAPKVVILRQAAIYCDLLAEIGQKTMATVEELKNRQDKLRSKLSLLRRNFRTERNGAEVRNSNHHNRRGRRGSGLQG